MIRTVSGKRDWYTIFLPLVLISLLRFATGSHAADIRFESAVFIGKISEAPLRHETLAYRPLDRQSHIALGFETEADVWLRLTFANPSDREDVRVLMIDNPLLEYVTLYTRDKRIAQGLLERNDPRHLYPLFRIPLPAHTRWNGYLHVRNRTSMLNFGFALLTEKAYAHLERSRLLNATFFLGLIAGLMLYALFLFVYTRDRSYLFYALYLGALLYHQTTYIGLLPMFAPHWLRELDNLIVVPKNAALIITGALFAQSFLRTKRMPAIHRGYTFFIVTTLLLIPLVGFPGFYHPEAIVVIGLLFIFFNYAAGIVMYRRGVKQARFFIAAWSVLIFGFFFITADALGLISVMYRFPQLILWLTALEALLLMLAFADRVKIYQEQKNMLHQRLMRELRDRQELIEKEVAQRTAELQDALREKMLLLQELHHRVKNNLQLILSILRLQNDQISDPRMHSAFEQLEHRIGAIAKTHEILYRHKEVETVEMRTYLQILCDELIAGFGKDSVGLTLDTDARLPLREAVYTGLIVNEIITNVLKYAHFGQRAAVILRLKQNGGDYRLDIRDNARPAPCRNEHGGIGLSIVTTLVTDQLEGTIERPENSCNHIRIRFSL